LARILVGIGEATAFPVAMSMIPDLFRTETRGRAVSIYQSSNFVGIVGGAILAGVLAALMGWRSMFIVCGGAGLAVAALLALTVREPARARADDESPWPTGPIS
jgi:MFS family permease